VYRRILGLVYENGGGGSTVLTNKEIYAMVKKPTTTETIRLKRLYWFGHIQRMEENRISQIVVYMNLETARLKRQTKKQMAR
jgi:hypothetical protein